LYSHYLPIIQDTHTMMSLPLFVTALALLVVHPTLASAVDSVDYLKQANNVTSDNHLWFYYVNTFGRPDLCKNGICRCGDIDAAARMPAELFLPENKAELEEYTNLTLEFFSSLGMGSDKLKLGQCNQETDYICDGGGVQGINWVTDALMSPICKKQCDCAYPSCPDVPDDPANGKFCSLCGPKYNNYITINLWNEPNPPPYGKYGPCGQLYIPDTIESTPGLSTLYAALKAADLVDTLHGTGPFTVFAPTDEAFAALPAGTLTNLLKPENKAQLVDVLTYHVVSGDLHAKDLMDMDMLTTVEGKDVTVRVAGNNILINSAKVTAADNDASNGVVHVIDAVLMPGDAPAPAAQTIVDLAVATPDLSTLVTALKAADLVGTLSGKGPFTVFAPTNEAFAALPDGVLDNLLKPENKAQLVDVLTYHVAAGDVHAKDLYDMEMITTVEGQNVTARVSGDSVFINSAKVVTADVDASNGVVHIVDGVLMP